MLAIGTISVTALAQVDIGATEPEAEVSQYVGPEEETGEPEQEVVPEAEEGAPAPDVAAGGQLAFTGLTILPQLLVGVALLFMGAAVARRMRQRSAAT